MTEKRSETNKAQGMKRRVLTSAFGALLVALSLGTFGMVSMQSDTAEAASDGAVAIFAGGCFWCVESDFDKIPGVLSTTSGYTGGALKNPTYKQVSYTETGHFEAVKIVYDPKKVSYRTLVDHFFRSVDPTDAGGQFCDRGSSYKTAVFTTSAEQRKVAQAVKSKYEKSGILKKPIVTPIKTAAKFWRAENYHQNYYTRNPLRYKYYRYGCGRDKRLKALWGDKAWPK